MGERKSSLAEKSNAGSPELRVAQFDAADVCYIARMTMRAVIAMPTGADPLPRADAPAEGFFARLFGGKAQPQFQGVYLHNGGPPSEIGPLLFNLVKERAGGVEGAWRELITDNAAGWSSISFFYDAATTRAWDGKTKVGMAVHQDNFDNDRPDPGPVTYAGDPQRDLGFRTPPIVTRSDKMGAATVWVICRSELVLYLVEQNGIGVREVARFPWTSTPDWDGTDATLDAAFGG